MQALILPRNINSLENANTLSACNLLTSNSSQTIGEVAAHKQTLIRNGIDVSAAEYELGRPYIVIGNHRESCTDRALNCSCQMQKWGIFALLSSWISHVGLNLSSNFQSYNLG